MKRLALGSLLGIAAALSPGGVFVLLLVAVTCRVLHRFVAQENRVFLIRLFLIAFFLRMGLAVCLDMGSWIVEKAPPRQWGPPEYWNLGISDKTRDYLRLGDSDYYSQRGYCLAHYAGGNREPTVLRHIQMYGYHAYLLIIGWFYYTFGFSPFSVKWLNGWFGSLNVLALFFLARPCFQSSIARWASALAAFFPTLALWSATNLKDPLFVLLTTLLMLFFMAFRSRPGLKRGLIYGGVSLPVFWVLQSLGRAEIGLVLAACLLLVFCLEWCMQRRWYAALLLGVVVLMSMNPWAKLKGAIAYGVYRHMGYSQTDSMTYHYLSDRFYASSGLPEGGNPMEIDPSGVMARIPVALLHYFLQPFPYRTVSGASMLMIPQMMLWYFLLPFAGIGIGAGVRWNTWNCGFLAVTLSAWVLIGALSVGNVGILIRIRDMATPIVLIFAAAGFWVFTRGRENFAREAPDRASG